MKAPKYFVETPQQAHSIGINPFALTLLAESFADKPERFGDENVVFLAQAHNGQRVWFIMSKTQPRIEDFDPEPITPESTPKPPDGGAEPNKKAGEQSAGEPR